MPAAKLPTPMGSKVDVLEFAKQNKKKNLLLVFFRTGTCGICVQQLDEIQSNIQEIRNNNAEVLAISLDDAITMSRTAERIKDYPLLLDPDGKTVKAFGVFNPDEKLSRPSVYLIGPDKKVLYSYVGRGLSDRPTTATLMQAVKHYSGLMPTKGGSAPAQP